MGFIRGSLLILVSVTLFLSLFALNLSGILSSSLNYNNFEKEVVPIAGDFLKDNVGITNYVQTISPQIKLYCQNNSEYVFSQQDYTFDIPCSVALQGEDAIIKESTKDLIHGIYYKEYNCNFFDCIKQTQSPLFLVSEKTYNYCTNKFYLILLVSFLLFIGVFLLAKKKTNALILSGILVILPSLAFVNIEFLLSLIPNPMISQFVGVFLSQAFAFSIRVLIAGILLVIFGIILKIFRVGFWISELIEKMKKSKTSVKKETKTAKKSKSK